MARDISKYVIEITDDASWQSVMDLSDEKLIVLDCHQNWCGQCEAVIPTFQRLFLDYANAEKRLGIAHVAIDFFKANIQALIPHDAHVDVNKIGCLPLFLLLRFKACVAVVQGVDTPGITQHVAMNIPDNKASEEI